MPQLDTWFGPEEAPLLGFLTMPVDGRVRGGVVLCPPIGHELVVAYRAMRLAAQELAAHGIATLRFDYAGEGDSAGESGTAEAPERWIGAVREAVGTLRAAGAPSVTVVGLTSGALLASEAAAGIDDLDGLILWDPVLAGSRFLRRQRTLYELTVDEGSLDDESRVSLVSYALHPEAAAWLETVAIQGPALAASAADVLVLLRSSVAGAPAATRLAAALPAGAVRAIDGQEELLEVPSALSRMPVEGIGAIVAHLDARLPAAGVPIRPTVRGTARVGRAADGIGIVETLRRIGPHDLFAITTARADWTPDDERSTLVLQPGASDHRIGPGRFQVRAARELAGRGFRVVRFDRRITGESSPVLVDEPNMIFAEAWVEDADHIAAELDADRLGMVGLCSGAWAGARMTARRPADLTVLISPNYYKRHALAPGAYAELQRQEAARVPRFGRIKGRIRDAIPGWMWRVAARTQLFHDPGQLLAAPARHPGSTVAVILSADDREQFLTHRGFDTLDRLRRRGGDIELISHETGDHSLFGAAARAAVYDDVIALVERRFPRRTRSVPPGAASRELAIGGRR